ncbi:MAG: amidohydrolase family protein [Vicinamibacterales bacterium]
MQRTLVLLSLSAVLAAGGAVLARQAPAAQPGPAAAVIPQAHVAFVNANVLDVRTGTALTGVTVVVEGGTIRSVGPGAAPAGAAVIDLGGRWLVPGLIDAHTHLATVDAARRALLSGVTTVRGASVSAYQDVAIRELVKAGYLAGPDVLAAGTFVTPDPPWLADPRMVALWPAIQSPEALRRLVQINKDRGADVIKTRGTERAGDPATDPREQVYTEAQLRVVVEEATRLGMDVLCHAHGTEGSEAAIRAGVRSIEHGTYLTPAQLETMAARGIFWVPTYSTIIDLTEPGGDYDDPVTANRGRFMLPILRRALGAGIRAGVKIVAGGDSAYGPESQTRISHEVANFVEAGMAPLQALQSATTTAAELLRLDGRTGAIEPGLEADLIVIEANPLEDVVALQDPLLIMSNGRLALNRLNFGR